MTVSYEIELAVANDVAEECEESRFDARMLGYVMRTLEPHLTRGGALQVGTFGGALCERLVDLYDRVTVVDPAARYLTRARTLVGERARYHQSLFETFRTTERFDAILMVHLLEHVTDPVTTLARARSLLTERGRIFVVVPNANAASRQIAVRMGLLPDVLAMSEADLRHGHRRAYTIETLERDVAAAGLALVTSGGIFFKPLANNQLDALAGGPHVTEAYLEGCFELGRKYPDLSANAFAVAAR